MAKLNSDPDLLKALGENIARLRGRQTQFELAIKSGVDVSTISDIETGRRNPAYLTLVQLAEALDVEVEDIIRRGGALTLEMRLKALEKSVLKRRTTSAVKASPKRKPAAKRKASVSKSKRR